MKPAKGRFSVVFQQDVRAVRFRVPGRCPADEQTTAVLPSAELWDDSVVGSDDLERSDGGDWQ